MRLPETNTKPRRNPMNNTPALPQAPLPVTVPKKDPTYCNHAMIESSGLIVRLLTSAVEEYRLSCKNFKDINLRVVHAMEAMLDIQAIQDSLRIDIDSKALEFHQYCNELTVEMTTANVNNSPQKAQALLEKLEGLRDKWSQIHASRPKPGVSVIEEDHDQVFLGLTMSKPSVDNELDNVLQRSSLLMARAKEALSIKPRFDIDLGMSENEKEKMERMLQNACHRILEGYSKGFENKAKEIIQNYAKEKA